MAGRKNLMKDALGELFPGMGAPGEPVDRKLVQSAIKALREDKRAANSAALAAKIAELGEGS